MQRFEEGLRPILTAHRKGPGQLVQILRKTGAEAGLGRPARAALGATVLAGPAACVKAPSEEGWRRKRMQRRHPFQVVKAAAGSMGALPVVGTGQVAEVCPVGAKNVKRVGFTSPTGGRRHAHTPSEHPLHKLRSFSAQHHPMLIALGACAVTGGLPAQCNHLDVGEMLEDILHDIDEGLPCPPDDPEPSPLPCRGRPVGVVVRGELSVRQAGALRTGLTGACLCGSQRAGPNGPPVRSH
ncbi:hypothetical protein CKO11_11630 [Rhodobacter sp. TJ_12]|uniref:hypothetical protein n=1 Tax=Rhodobacter sp. TJ_12 TaxID=2029399 RepID=UPI001CBC2EFA|nr:hypothetical protein [Rhodobacter sp. TJ_12]MBZ4023110.1 hypothetical protein [Rhodobacter sp. TJ_12]